MNKEEKVLVKWYDAKFSSATLSKEEIYRLKMALFESVGFLVSRDKTTTIIAGEHNDECQYRDITLIPSGSIISIRKLMSSSLM